LSDRTGAGAAPIALAGLGGRATFTATVEDGRGVQSVALALDPARNVASGRFRAGPPGRYAARGQVRLSGFVTPASTPAEFEVIDTRLALQATIAPLEACPSCAPGEIGATLAPGGRARDIAAVSIATTGELAAAGTAVLSGLPPWLVLVDAAGAEVGDRTAVRLDPAAPARLALRMRDTALPATAAPVALTLRVTADPPSSGEAVATVTVRPVVPTARLVPTGSAKGGPETTPTLSGDELRARSVPLDFLADGVLKRPAAGEVTTAFADRRLDLCVGTAVETADFRIQVTPWTRWYCPALLWFANGPQPITVTWRAGDGLQTASATVTPRLAVTDWEALVSATEIAAALAAVAYALYRLLVIAGTRRFPRGAVLEIAEGADLPRYVQLRRLHWTPLRLLFGRRNETRRAEGVELAADTGGAWLGLHNTQGDIVISGRGQSVREILEEQPHHPDLKLLWNDELERPGRPKVTMRLRRTLGGDRV
jgi:hypothetical protein